MPSIYAIIKDYYPSPQFAGKLSTEELRLGKVGVANLAGVKIMATKPTTFQQLFAAFCTYVHHPGRYTWNGSAGGASGSPLLDNDQVVGECGMYARALQILSYAPAPYGLGLAKTAVNFTSYSGSSRKGFVSTHAAPVMRLNANVNAQGLYFWENHKVLSYNGVYYDVMYQTTYNQLAEMGAYHIMDTYPLGGAEYHQAEMDGQSQGYWFKEHPVTGYDGPSPSMPF